MRKLLTAAHGQTLCDLVIKGGRVANVLSMEYEAADIAVANGIIVGVGQGYRGKTEVDAHNAVLMPGMIDGHLHIESTMLAPGAFASAVVPLGSTTVICDPHEIANTCGRAGLEFMSKEAQRAPLDAFFSAPSCVPASSFETPYHKIDAAMLEEYYADGLCSSLGEMMNFPGVINGHADVWSMIEASAGLVKNGHAPGLCGHALCAYLLSGCDSDHECNYADEALEKLRRGMWIMLREGAIEHNLDELLELILEDEARYSRFMAVSDDLSAEHILTEGHLDHLVRKMIKKGIRPLIAAALVSITPANYFRLWDRGAIAPGRIADIIQVESLEECRAEKVWKRGVLVAEAGKALFAVPEPDTSGLPTVQLTDYLKNSSVEKRLKVNAQPGKNIRVMEIIPGKVITRQLILEPMLQGDQVISDVDRDILKVVVLEKNRSTGNLATGFVRGFGLKKGAIASSVAHDAHNFIAVGVDDRSILTALEFLVNNNGGLVVADGEEVKQSLPLPIGGLMSTLKAAELVTAFKNVGLEAAGLGLTCAQPFMALSFLSLSVLPELKLTDQGYIGILSGGKLPLFV
ncbi:MAG: adenine deaminase [Deltaproteobacteria bacterium]|jgi:adenine deaminase|nr:adenine deaminase [Deltaproteobacteria bacterium]